MVAMGHRTKPSSLEKITKIIYHSINYYWVDIFEVEECFDLCSWFNCYRGIANYSEFLELFG